MPVQFHPQDSYISQAGTYRFLPFQFMRWPPLEVLVVNQAGEYHFLNRADFTEFVGHRLERAHPAYADLKSKHFLIDSDSLTPIHLLATKYRSKKAFLEGFLKLHLFVVTLRCDHSCPYCQVSRVTMDRSRFDMTPETARRSVELMLESPATAIKVEFQGGEPLLNLELMKQIVSQTELHKGSKFVEYVVATNLANLDGEALRFLHDNNVSVSTSLDGPEFLHNRNRPRAGNDGYQRAIDGIQRVRSAMGHDRVSALMTTTAETLKYPCEVIDEYARQQFTSIFLRPISPYGFAARSRTISEYQADAFLDFYKRGLSYIVELNRRGIAMVEVFAQILLTKMLTPFATGYVDLQSPAGAGINAVAYNYDGNVYASDEARMLAEMDDRTFCLGNVHTNTYQQLFGSRTNQLLVENSVVESLPGCCDCAFQMYCGGDPIYHHAAQHDMVGHRPTSDFCRRNMSIIKHLFNLLRDGDQFTKDLLLSWATRVRTID